MVKPNIKAFLDKEINKRVKGIQAGKERRTPEGAIKRFMVEVDKIQVNSVDAADFYMSMEQEGRLLDDAVYRIDPYAKVSILWANRDDEQSWKDLRLEAVQISWSQKFIEENPASQASLYVSYISMMLEGTI